MGLFWSYVGSSSTSSIVYEAYFVSVADWATPSCGLSHYRLEQRPPVLSCWIHSILTISFFRVVRIWGMWRLTGDGARAPDAITALELGTYVVVEKWRPAGS